MKVTARINEAARSNPLDKPVAFTVVGLRAYCTYRRPTRKNALMLAANVLALAALYVREEQ